METIPIDCELIRQEQLIYQIKKYDINNKNYPFYVYDSEDNKIINGLTSLADCKEFIKDLCEEESQQANYIIITKI